MLSACQHKANPELDQDTNVRQNKKSIDSLGLLCEILFRETKSERLTEVNFS